MEQQQYHYHPENAKPKDHPEKKGRNRRLGIWSPLLVKWGVSFAVSIAAMILFELVTLVKQVGTGSDLPATMAKIQALMQEYMADQDSMNELILQITNEISRYTTQIEGISALLTIPFLCLMFYRDRLREKALGILPNKRAEVWKYSGIVVLAAAMTLGLNNLIAISGISASSSSYEETMSVLYSASVPIQVLCLGVLIPICEEMVFRALIYKRLRVVGSFLPAALYSTAIFSLLHVNIVQMLYAFCMGFAFCWVYEKYGSVLAPILAHGVSNILSIILTQTNTLGWLEQEQARIGVVTILCATIASTAYVLMRRIDEAPEQAEEEPGQTEEVTGQTEEAPEQMEKEPEQAEEEPEQTEEVTGQTGEEPEQTEEVTGQTGEEPEQTQDIEETEEK